MYRIIDARSTGKTSRLMLLAKETNGTIVCANPMAMQEKAKAYGITGINFISYRQLIDQPIEPFGNYYIDELENFVKTILVGKGSFQGYTLSED